MNPDFCFSFLGKNLNQQNPRQKTTYMSKPSHSATSSDVQHLQQKPESKDHSCGDANNLNEKNWKNQSQNPGPRKQDQIGTQYSGDRSAGSNHWILGIEIEKDMSKTRP